MNRRNVIAVLLSGVVLLISLATYFGLSHRGGTQTKVTAANKPETTNSPVPIASPVTPAAIPTNGENPFASALAKVTATKDAVAKAQKAKISLVSTLCKQGLKCEIGSIGPGGGLVFYDAGTKQWWGRYLEAAPKTWHTNSGDPTSFWCDVTDVFFRNDITNTSLAQTLGPSIGNGRADTYLMIAGCKKGAANLARSYHGGGKSDWFLPSKDELALMFKNKAVIGGFVNGYYWSSSENDPSDSWDQNFTDGAQNLHLKGHKNVYVRPIRAF